MHANRASRDESYTLPRFALNALEQHVPSGEFYRSFHEACAVHHLANLVQVKLWPRRAPPPENFFPDASRSPDFALSEASEMTVERTMLPESSMATCLGAQMEDMPESWLMTHRDMKVPRLFLELEQPDNGDSATRIGIRDWELDIRMLDVLNSSCNQLERLKALNLWNAGVTGKTLPILISFLSSYTNIRELRLDCNPLPGESFHRFLQEPLRLQFASFRYCSMTDKGAIQLAKELGDIQRSNVFLLGLNLTGNCVSNEGAIAFASALRMNRTLLTLSLAGNSVGDEGAKALAECLSMSRLTPEEKKLRMTILYDTIYAAVQAERQALVEQISSVRVRKQSLVAEPKDHHDKTIKAGKDSIKSKEDKKEPISDAANMKKTVPAKTEQAEPAPRKTDDTATPPGILHHLVRKNKQGITCLEGNLALLNLNLAMNHIGNAGIRALSKAVVYQQEEVLPTSKHGPGLKRMRLDGNLVRENDANYLKILVLLKSLDPLFKYLQTLTEQMASAKDEDAQSSSNWSEDIRADNVSTAGSTPRKKKGK